MATKDEMIERYEQLYQKMVTSKDPKNMKIFGESEKWVFKEVAKVHPELAQSWLSHLEAVCWDNYLDEKEALNIGKRMKNSDGTTGFHWPYEVFVKAVSSLGGTIEEKPFYNSYALWVAANMIYSDMATSIAEDMGHSAVNDVPQDKMALSCYKKAVAYLKDKDGIFRIRNYFKKTMYDNMAE